MIRLVDFLKLPSDKAKIKFNMNPSDPTTRAWCKVTPSLRKSDRGV